MQYLKNKIVNIYKTIFGRLGWTGPDAHTEVVYTHDCVEKWETGQAVPTPPNPLVTVLHHLQNAIKLCNKE